MAHLLALSLLAMLLVIDADTENAARFGDDRQPGDVVDAPHCLDRIDASQSFIQGAVGQGSLERGNSRRSQYFHALLGDSAPRGLALPFKTSEFHVAFLLQYRLVENGSGYKLIFINIQ